MLAIKQIPASPPLVNNTHPRENEKCVQFFFLHECFGAIIPFEKPKIENQSHLNWINLQRDEHGNWVKTKITLICSKSELFYAFYTILTTISI